MTVIAPLLLTLFIGFSGGWISYQLGIPAPFMMGSLFISWLIVKVVPFRKLLGIEPSIPIPFRRTMLGITGVMLGSFLDQTTFNHGWWDTMLAVLLVTLSMTLLCFSYLIVRGKDPMMAWLASLPGGLSELVILAGRYTKQDHVVAIYHLFRLTSVFILIPTILSFVDWDLVRQMKGPNQVFIIQAEPLLLVLLVVLVGCGMILAKFIPFPMAAMFWPLLLSACYHILGFPPIVRIFELLVFVQIILGSGIGLRLAQAKMSVLRPHFFDALIATTLILGGTGLLSWGLAHLLEEEVLKLFLIFVPGGINEIALLSLVFGYEVAFITVHHSLRIVFIIFAAPLGISWQAKKRKRTDKT